MFSEMIVVELKGLEFHRLSDINPEQTESEYLTLKNSIELEGQLVPIIRYKGKVVDGKHRTRAMRELNHTTINVVDIPHNTTLADVKEILFGIEHGRRAQTSAQKAIQALRFKNIHDDTTDKEVILKFGISSAQLNYAKRIYRPREEKIDKNGKVRMVGFGRPDLLNDMFIARKCFYNGKSYTTLAKLIIGLEMDTNHKEEPKYKSETSETYDSIIDLVADLSQPELTKLRIAIKDIADVRMGKYEEL